MPHTRKQSGYLVIEDEPEKANFDYWSQHPSLKLTTQQALREADILIIPNEGFRNNPDLIFPVGTEELFQSLREKAPKDIKVDIAIEDHDYKELALHFDEICIADFLVKNFIAPFLVNFIAGYLLLRLGSRLNKASVRCAIVVEQNGKNVRFSYDGPATLYEATMRETLRISNTKKKTEKKNIKQKSPSPRKKNNDS